MNSSQMSPVSLINPSAQRIRDATIMELIKGEWFVGRETFLRFHQCLELGTRLTASLIEPAHQLFTLTRSDYDALLKTALAHWIRKNKEMATIFHLATALWSYGFNKAADAVKNIDRMEGTLRQPRNGAELQECLDNCEPGDTILLKPSKAYHGKFVAKTDNVKIQGSKGSKLVGVKAERILDVLGNDCILDGIHICGNGNGVCFRGDRNTMEDCTFLITSDNKDAILLEENQSIIKRVSIVGSVGILVFGNRCKIGQVKMTGMHGHGIAIEGSNNHSFDILIGCNAEGNAVSVNGTKNCLEKVETISCQGRLFCGGTEGTFTDCTFASACHSVIMAGNNQFRNVKFVNGVAVVAGFENICMTRCTGDELILEYNAQLEAKECIFSERIVKTSKEVQKHFVFPQSQINFIHYNST